MMIYFDDFYGKFNDKANISLNFDEKMFDSKLVRKILKSSHDRFQPKVTVIKKIKDVDNLKLDELVGNTQA